jgi:hypothetical protein
LVHELSSLFEAKDEGGALHTPADADLLATLRALEGALLDVARESAGPTAFLDTTARLAGRIAAANRPAARPLIVEP